MPAVRMEADVGRASAAAGGRVQKRQLAVLAIDVEGADGSLLVAPTRSVSLVE